MCTRHISYQYQLFLSTATIFYFSLYPFLFYASARWPWLWPWETKKQFCFLFFFNDPASTCNLNTLLLTVTETRPNNGSQSVLMRAPWWVTEHQRCHTATPGEKWKYHSQFEKTCFSLNKHKINKYLLIMSFCRCNIWSERQQNVAVNTYTEPFFMLPQILCTMKPRYPDMWSARRGTMSFFRWAVHYSVIIRSWEGPLGRMIWLHIFIQTRSPWREIDSSFHLCTWLNWDSRNMLGWLHLGTLLCMYRLSFQCLTCRGL